MRLSLLLESHGGTKAGFVVPDEVVEALGAGGRPRVAVTIHGPGGAYTYRSSIARMGGRHLLGVSNEHRTAAGVAAGEVLDVDLVVDEAPRGVEVPDDLAAALADDPAAATAWAALAPSRRKEHARQLTSAKRPETRERRLAAVLQALAG